MGAGIDELVLSVHRRSFFSRRRVEIFIPNQAGAWIIGFIGRG